MTKQRSRCCYTSDCSFFHPPEPAGELQWPVASPHLDTRWQQTVIDSPIAPCTFSNKNCSSHLEYQVYFVVLLLNTTFIYIFIGSIESFGFFFSKKT